MNEKYDGRQCIERKNDPEGLCAFVRRENCKG
jgi:hypothetical protein